MKRIIIGIFIAIILLTLIVGIGQIGLRALPYIVESITTSYKRIRKSSQEELKNILCINDENSFKLIYIKHESGFVGSSNGFYDIKFELSVEDYEKNTLNYSNESYNLALMDCSYKEKKDDTIYICIKRISRFGNEELYQKISQLK